MREDIKFEPFDQAKYEAGFRAIADEVDAKVMEKIIKIAEEGVYNAIIDELDNRGETDEEKAYRRGWMDGYDEGLYDGQYK